MDLKLYKSTYDNGEKYEMNEQSVIGIFDTYDEIKRFALNNGFSETSYDDCFVREDMEEYIVYRDYIFIEEFVLNKITKKFLVVAEDEDNEL